MLSHRHLDLSIAHILKNVASSTACFGNVKSHQHQFISNYLNMKFSGFLCISPSVTLLTKNWLTYRHSLKKVKSYLKHPKIKNQKWENFYENYSELEKK